MASYTLTRTEEGRITLTLRYDEGDQIGSKVQELLLELTASTPKPGTFTDAMRADWDDKVRAASAKTAFDDFRCRARFNSGSPRILVAKNELRLLAEAGFESVTLGAIRYSGWEHAAPTEAAAREALAYMEAALVTYPEAPGPETVYDYLNS